MLASIIIIAVSIGLFLYWFRYTCVLILNTRTAKDYTGDVAAANQLSFLGVQEALQSMAAEPALDGMQASLQRDYKLVSYLLRNAGSLRAADESLEDSMLRIDFQLMKVWYAASRRLAPNQARLALNEMSQIVGHLANSMGERLASGAEA